MDLEKEKLYDQLNEVIKERDKYKEITMEYEKKLNTLNEELQSIKNNTTKISTSSFDMKRDINDIIGAYNCLKEEHSLLETEFLRVIDLAENNPRECIDILKEYAIRMHLVQEAKNTDNMKYDRFRVIKGGKDKDN